MADELIIQVIGVASVFLFLGIVVSIKYALSQRKEAQAWRDQVDDERTRY